MIDWRIARSVAAGIILAGVLSFAVRVFLAVAVALALRASLIGG